MGAVDLVVQVESPGSVASGLQRIGRAGHQVGEPSRGKIFPKFRGDLLEAQRGRRAHARRARSSRRAIPRNPLDVLAQQIVAMCAVDEWRGRGPVRTRSARGQLRRALARRVPGGARPARGPLPQRWVRRAPPPGRVGSQRRHACARATGAGRIAITNGGTIPDRGLFGVFLPDGTRVGELDEEMVYESPPRRGLPAGGVQLAHRGHHPRPGRGVPGARRARQDAVLARRQARAARWSWGARSARSPASSRGTRTRCGAAAPARRRRARRAGLHRTSSTTLTNSSRRPARSPTIARWWSNGSATRSATGGCACSRRSAPRVHAPVGPRDRGPARRPVRAGRPGAVERRRHRDPPARGGGPHPGRGPALRPRRDRGTRSCACFRAPRCSPACSARRARERCCSRASGPASARRLWQQRQRSADLLTEAAKHPTFPMLLETTRECLRDVFDVPALREVMARPAIAHDEAGGGRHRTASPFAQSLLFRWIAVAMYEGDAPLAERRATALALDRDLLRELLGSEELRDLLDPAAIDQTELELQWLADGRRARGADGVHDLLRTVGDLTDDEIDASHRRRRCRLGRLVDRGRPRDAGARGGRGARRCRRRCRPPPRRARRLVAHGPARRLHRAVGPSARRPGRHGTRGRTALHAPRRSRPGSAHPPERVRDGARGARGSRARVAAGAFRPGGSEREWCDEGVLRRLRQRSLAALATRGGAGRRRGTRPVPARLAGSGPSQRCRRTRSARPSRGSRGRRSRPRSWRPTSCRRACGATGRPTSTPCSRARRPGVDGRRVDRRRRRPRRALLPGTCAHPAGARDRASATDAPDRRAPRCDPRRTWPRTARRSGPTWCSPPVPRTSAWCSRASGTWCGRARSRTTRCDPLRSFVRGAGARVRAPRPGSRPRPGALRRTGPPAGAGRWSLVAPLLSPAAVRHRSGARTRAAAARPSRRRDARVRRSPKEHPGGFAGVYPVLRAMEEAGKVRRGYFIAGLGAAQFSLPGAVDRLRAAPRCRRGRPRQVPTVVLAAADPAQPYGAALPWPRLGRPALTRRRCVRGAERRRAPPRSSSAGRRSLVTFDAAPERGWTRSRRSSRTAACARSSCSGSTASRPAMPQWHRRVARRRVRRRLPGAHPPG